MTLYHTGGSEIRRPDLSIGRANADFGQGFYLSSDESFAGNWARERTASDIYVNKYELDTEGLAIKKYEKGSEWYDFITGNRSGRNLSDPQGSSRKLVTPSGSNGRDPDGINTVYSESNKDGGSDPGGHDAGCAAYDVIIGPIAGDTLFDTLGMITSGVLTREQAIELFCLGPAFEQVVIRTEKAAAQLKWISSRTLSAADIRKALANYNAAREDYESQLYAAIDSML